jgi:hypothetical protein
MTTHTNCNNQPVPSLLLCAALQELRLLFDASGGGGRLNPIQLSALLQHLSRVAPAPELLTASERAELQGFALEVRAWGRVLALDLAGHTPLLRRANWPPSGKQGPAQL